MLGVKDFVYVIIQFVLLILFFVDIELFKIEVLLFDFWLYFSLFGFLIIVIAVLQLNTSLSPFPSPKSDAKLVKTGLFKFIRHPIYTGILISVFSISFWLGSGYRFLISLAILILFYFKTRYEEKKLAEKFTEYEIYQSKTGRFLPRLF
ncbi:MAG: isoprenylcysteine carboxylmethyltransferase family protein [Psychroflexus sp.]